MRRKTIYVQPGTELTVRIGGESADEGPLLSLAAAEEQAVRRALAHTGGNQSRAARLLGCSRKTVWQKRMDYGINAEPRP